MTKQYIVEVREVHISHRLVTVANDADEGHIIDQALDESEELFLEYSHTPNEQDYKIQEYKETN